MTPERTGTCFAALPVRNATSDGPTSGTFVPSLL